MPEHVKQAEQAHAQARGDLGQPCAAAKATLPGEATVPFPWAIMGALLIVTGLTVSWAVSGHAWAAAAAFLAACLAVVTFLRWAGLRARGAGPGIWRTLETVRSYVANEPGSFEYERAGGVERSVPRP